MRSQTDLIVAVAALLAAPAAAQDLSALLSEARSIFTVATSFLGGDQSTTATTTSSSSSSTSSSTSASSTSSSSSTSSTASPGSITPTATTASSTSSAAAAASNGSDSHGSNTLAIVLGCTLGALALASFLALIYFFCIRRRKRRDASVAKHKSVPSDEEIDGWRHEKPRTTSYNGPFGDRNAVGHSTMPLIGGHHNATPHDEYGAHNGANPFVPAPPPARRSSRPGLSYDHTPESTVRPDHDPRMGRSFDGHHDDHHGEKLAAGAGGFALGGLAAHAAHRHERKRSESRDKAALLDEKAHGGFSEDEQNTLPQSVDVGRRSGSLSRASLKEPWPFFDANGRRSHESSRSRKRSVSYSRDDFQTPDQYPPGQAPSMPSHHNGLAGAAAGGLAGAGVAAAMAHRSGRKSPKNDRLAPRKGILKQTTSDSSDPSSFSRESYIPSPKAHGSGPHELGTPDYPAAHRNSMGSERGGYAAPAVLAAAAAASTHEHNKNSEVTRPHSATSQRRQSPTDVPPLVIPRKSLEQRRMDTPPLVPSRSPRRSSLTPNARYSFDYAGTAEMPSESKLTHKVSPEPSREQLNDQENVMSPVSPITASQPGTLTAAEAQELQAAAAARQADMSQDSTVVNSRASPDESGSSTANSGLLSAIQNIFSSQKAMWNDEEAGYVAAPTRRSMGDDNSTRYYANVPRSRPQPVSTDVERTSSHGLLDRTSPLETHNAATRSPVSPDSPVQRQRPTTIPYQQHNTSSHSLPSGRPTSMTSTNTNKGRSRATSGYGMNSGDPFDLAATRTDSQMTGISLSNYREPDRRGSREPTLAELRAQVAQEDAARQREEDRRNWRRSYAHARRSSSGSGSFLRYGNDSDLFGLSNGGEGGVKARDGPVLDAQGVDEYDAFYGQDGGRYPTERERSGRRRSSGASGRVGRAY